MRVGCFRILTPGYNSDIRLHDFSSLKSFPNVSNGIMFDNRNFPAVNLETEDLYDVLLTLHYCQRNVLAAPHRQALTPRTIKYPICNTPNKSSLPRLPTLGALTAQDGRESSQPIGMMNCTAGHRLQHVPPNITRRSAEYRQKTVENKYIWQGNIVHWSKAIFMRWIFI